MKRTLLMPALLVVGQLGCGTGGGGGSSKSSSASTTPPVTNTPATFSVSGFTPASAPANTTASLTISFGKPVDPNSLVEGTTYLAVEDDDTSAGGNFNVLSGTITFDATGTKAAFTPATPFQVGHEVRIAFTSGVKGTNGESLQTSAASAALSLQSVFADQVFEGRYMPTAAGTSTVPGPGLPGPGTTGLPTGSIPLPTQPPSTPAPGPSVAGAFEIVRTTPNANATDPVPTTIYIEFSSPVNKATLTGGSGGSLAVLQATNSSTTMSFPKFGIRWENGDTRLAIVPQPLFTAGKDIFVLFGTGLKDVNGKSLTKGAVSSTISKKTWLASLVFELKFTPTKVPTPSFGGDPSIFALESGTDPWFIDFDLRASQFSSDMSKHGLLSTDATTNGLAKARIMATLLGTLSMKYGRTHDGKGQAGAWKISFTAKKPAGTAGKEYSREAIGGLPPSQGTLGISNMDTGNNSFDDNGKSGSGIFAAVIFGTDSKLDPILSANDRQYLDGSYSLGSGTAAQDARMVRVHMVIDDWSRALASVTAHECGHSVGLSHVDAALSIMDSASTDSQLSEPRTFFYPSSAALLDANLGTQ
ncbi:MAG: Ig-like domain-containing protein [Planctomycetota bacterium]